VKEKDRQIDLMRGNIDNLRTSIAFGEEVAMKKVHHYLHDNENLLVQMNSMRHEVWRHKIYNYLMNIHVT
jgi:hypothetical protein